MDELLGPALDLARLPSTNEIVPILAPVGDIQGLLNQGISLQESATRHGIHNVFDDGGYKELLLLTLFDLQKLNREGDDAQDADGRRYEIKTVARVSSSGVRKKSLSITTEHTLTQANIDRYRGTFLWIVAVFDQAVPEVIFEVRARELEPFFRQWEERLGLQGQSQGGAPNHLNNPKIPLGFIRQHGVQVWPVGPSGPSTGEVATVPPTRRVLP